MTRIVGGLLRQGMRAGAAFASCLLCFSEGLAQTASQITPPSFRPDQPRAGGALLFSGRPGLDAPAGAERLWIRLSGVSIEGGRRELAAEQQRLQARLTRGRIQASELFAAARELEAAYARAGYVLTRVLLPAQNLRDGGRLRIVIVSGFVERIDTSAVPETVRARVERVLAPLIGRRELRLSDIERQLVLAGDTPGVALRSALSPGGELGATVLVVQAQYRPMSGTLGFDNTLSGALGRSTVTAGAEINSVLGFGETFYVRAAGHPGGSDAAGFGGLFDQYPRMRTLSGGAVIPLGIDGLTLNLEATESRTTPKPTFGQPQTASVFERYSVRLRYPWIRSRALTLASELIFDAEEERVDILVPGAKLPISLDRLRVLRVATDGAMQLPTGGTLSGRAILSAGLDALGARSAASASPLLPLSRLGADADFRKLEAIVALAQPLNEHLGFALLARGQTSFNQALPRAEQLGIASFQELSTFDAGTLGGDSGWIVRAEVNSPWQTSLAGVPITATPYAFAATGALYLERPTALEQGTTHVSSIGLGLRLAATLDPSFSQASLALEFGRRYRDDLLPNSNRFTMVGSIRF